MSEGDELRVREGLRRVVARAESLCRSRWFVLACASTAVLLVLPALSNGLQTEDHFQRSLGWSTRMYGSGEGDVYENYGAKDAGLLPWIASDDLRIRFFRPLSSLSLSFDYQVLPSDTRWPYAQSFLWLALLVASAAMLFRRINGTWGAGALAALLFAVDEVHGVAVGWLAARHALVSGALVCVALVLYDRWRRDGGKVAGAFSSIVLSLALFSSEFAVGILGYFVAHSIFLDRAPIRRRLAASLAYVVPTAAWLVLYVLGHYGARGSGMYISPLDEPLVFARAVLFRAPWLLSSAFGIGWADLGAIVPDAILAPASLVAWTIVAAIFALLSPTLRRHPSARFWALGMVLASIPLCTSPAADRLLLLVSLSGMAFVDVLVSELASGRGGRVWRLAAGALACLWLLVHGILSPLHSPATTHAVTLHNDWLETASETACEGVVSGQQLIVLQAPNYYSGAMLAGLAFARGCRASHIRVLYGGFEEPVIERLDANTFAVHAEHGFLSVQTDRVYRSESRRFVAGQGLQLSSLQIVVVGITDTGTPRDVEFRFASPLEEQRWRFVGWNGQRYARLALPSVGQRVRMPGFGGSR